MTTQELMATISARYDMSGTTISSSSSEWNRRLVLINQAEDDVRRYLKGQWNFLLKSASLSTTANQSYVDLPDDFVDSAMAVGNNQLIQINGIYYRLVNYIDTLNRDTTQNYVWITGNKAAGFRLNIQPTPGGNYPFTFIYYTNNMATSALGVEKEKLTLADDITKVPDPYYFVDWVIGELYLVNDENVSKWEYFKETARKRLVDMVAVDNMNQNQQVYIKVGSEEDGYDIFNSRDYED